MPKNWKTTALGVCGLLTAVGSLGTDCLSGNFATVPMYLPAIATAVGLMFAHDAK